MPTSIKAIFSADASQSDKVMKQMAASSEATAKAMSRNFKREIAEIDAVLKKLPDGSLLRPKLEARKELLVSRIGPQLTPAIIAKEKETQSRAAVLAEGVSWREAQSKLEAEKQRYILATTQQTRSVNLRAGLAADDASWQARLAAFKSRQLPKSADMFQKPGGIGTSMIDGTIPAMNRATMGLRRYAGGYSQLLHSARASFDSIASGMPFDRVVMQQAPQVVQALMQMKLGYIALAVGAGVAVYKVSKYMSDLHFALRYGSAKALEASNTYFVELSTKARKARKDAEAVRILEEKGKGDVLSDEAKSLSLTEQTLDAQAELAKEKLRGADIDKQIKGTLTDELELKRKLAHIDKRRIDLRLNADIEANKKKYQAEQSGIHAALMESRFDKDAQTDSGKLKTQQLEGQLNRSKAEQSLSEGQIMAEATAKSVGVDIDLKKAGLDFKNKNVREPINPARFNLNSMQRIGAYAAAPPDWALLVQATKETAANTRHLKPQPIVPVITQAVSHGAPFQRGQAPG